MKFYKDSDDLYHINAQIVPASMCILEQYPNEVVRVISVESKREILPSVEVSLLKKEDGSTYADLASFITDNAEFFL